LALAKGMRAAFILGRSAHPSAAREVIYPN
jgi:hypothetical protein